jgi:hypothetical protein
MRDLDAQLIKQTEQQPGVVQVISRRIAPRLGL